MSTPTSPAPRPTSPRPCPARSRATVVTADRGDDVVLDGLLDECTALRQLDTDLAEHYGAPGLVADVWRAAYGRRPHLLDPGEVEPARHVTRAIMAGMVGSPEHTELRQATEGDAYAAALSAVAQGPALRRMLTQLDTEREQAGQAQAQRDQAEQAEQATAVAQQAAAADAESHADEADGAADGADGGQAAIEATEAAERAAAADEQADRAESELDQALAAAALRAQARAAAAGATEAVEADQAALGVWASTGSGELEHLDADERMRLSEKLRTGKLAAFAELIGRFRQLARAQRARRVEHARGEYVGITLGDDLDSLNPAELANLAVPALRAEFAARYAESRLMVYDQRGEDHEAQGAIIAVVDCSHSMQIPAFGDDLGMPGDAAGPCVTAEAYAKACTLALLEQARAATPVREFAAVLFSSAVDVVLPFPATEPVRLADKIELADRFAGGGTDFQSPLEVATQLLADEYNTTGRQRADIVLITDGQAPVEEDWLAHWRREKHRLDFRCFGIQLDVHGTGQDDDVGEELLALCDDVRPIGDLTDPHATASLFRAI